MKKLGAFALALVFLIGNALLGASGQAAAQPAVRSPEWLRLDIERMTPRLATPDEDTLRVTGSVTNVGDRRISDIVARLQIGQRQGTERQLRSTLTGSPATDAGASEWSEVATTLEPGQSAELSIEVPLAELGLSAPGVYPLLVNVNGTPAYGGAARLAAVNLLLPVIDPPAETPPVAVSMLWPITSAPKLVADPHDGPVVLADDRLAEELAPGGRLDALVTAASAYRDNPDVFGSLCFAVDPDLLETVAAMAEGYQVQSPTGPVQGSGREQAARWLQALRELVSGHCVVQIPYADADLGALSKVSTRTDLVADAVNNGAAILNLLRVQPRAGVLWPNGSLGDAALRAAAGAGTTTVLTDPAQLGANASDGTAMTTTAGVNALGYDSLVASAFAGTARADSVANQPNVATQNGLAALAFRAGLGDETAEAPVLVAPPHGWDASLPELHSLLGSLARLHEERMLTPAPLDDLLAAPAGGNAVLDGADGADLAGSPVSDEVVAGLSDIEATAADLQRAMSVDPTRQVQPISLIQPLHNAVLRATSTAWDSPFERTAAATAARTQLESLGNQVTVTTPSQPVSLASGSSPLPVTLSNALPVAVTVRINLDNSAGLRTDRVQDTPLAANSRVGRLIPAEALRSGRFSVDVSLTTPGGTELGTPARLELTSNEFGVVTVVLTATAAGALFLLGGRRIYRRVRQRGQEGQAGSRPE